ncbi:hypothetical protein [Sorangium sp. So ce542]|uniref:hypothetical protein n=1 Tax=Sorangium sp. So ce542 TaxID=3133316 RepID=UPI003F600B2A
MGSLARRGAETSVVAVAVCVWGASTLAACTAYSDDCGEKLACVPDPEPPPDPCAGEPGTAPALDQCGVFVSERGDDRNPGTKRAPVKTLQHAIGLAASGRGKGEAPTRRVYACGGEFEEAVTLPSGVDLWGGRRCEAGEWSYGWTLDGPNHPTTIAPPVGIPLRVIAGAEDVTSTISGVRVVAADASAADGKSSIAMILSPGAKAKVMSSEVIAGNGKDGESGDDAPQERAKDGEEGNNGASACTADLAPGAPPVVTACDDGTESVGAYGGDGGSERGGDGALGLPSAASNPGNEGLGGVGADSARCESGEDGAKGADGGRAAGAFGVGYLTVDGWIGVRGEDGRKGGVGQGGGGGGGSKSRGPMIACPIGRPDGGAAGGSGGSGGCGGDGGKGGAYGGASIGIIVLQGAVLAVEDARVTAANGGRGGVGGTGQPGGGGQPGGYGGHGFGSDGRLWAGCDGGWGGNGGRGGDAGGGLGGASFGIASVGASVALAFDATVLPGQPGQGGLAGNAAPDDDEGKGAVGLARFWYRFDAPDPEPPQ